MDNNYLNNTNQNEQTTDNMGNSGYPQNGSTYNAYSQNPYAGTGSAQGNPYSQPVYGQPGMQRPGKKPKKKSGFGMMLAKYAAIAAVFGLVAGGVFTGVSYAGNKALSITQESSSEDTKKKNSGNSSAQVKQANTGEAKDLSDVSAIAREAMPSIVAITNTGTVSYQTFWGTQQRESESCGSGVIIKSDDKYLYIVTNNHVVADADTLTVQFSDNETVSCEVKGTDEADDLAVVKVALDSIKQETLDTIKTAVPADSDSLEVGQGVIAIGNALGYGQSVTNGIISALGRTVTVQDQLTGQSVVNNNMIQTNAAINPGNSGGALLNANGELIGINSVKYSDTDVEGFGYAIPISDAMPIVEQLITREKVDQAKSAYLGIQGQDISSDVASAYNMPEGVYVYEVMKGSAAEKAGIRQGDIITKFDGQGVSTMRSLKGQLSYYKAGQEVEITINRLENGYEEQTITVKLGAQSEAQKR